MIIGSLQPPLIIQTRAGNNIPFERGLKFTQQELLQTVQYIRGEFPEGQQLFTRKFATGAYNCHGMTFISRRGHLGDEQGVELILNDDEYYEVPLRDLRAGDVILYFETTGELQHSEIVVDVFEDSALIKRPWILSKWGNGGEFIHRYDYCLYNWRSIRYMREGRID